jgi:hypothetical protein
VALKLCLGLWREYFNIKIKTIFMKQYHLGFIGDEEIFNHVKNTILAYRFSINLESFNKNLIDPIKLTFDSKIYQRHIDDVIESEVIRQLDKSNTNHIGYFHQNIFKHIKNKSWKVPDFGYDIINQEESIYVEMKDKHNTMNSSSAQKTYIKMQNTVLNNSKAVCMLVEAIAKNSQNICWVSSVDGNKVVHKNIRRVSIDKFYEIATGDSLAFKELCSKLPTIIDDVVANVILEKESNTVLKELKAINKNTLKSLYLLSFKKYEGFNEFNL